MYASGSRTKDTPKLGLETKTVRATAAPRRIPSSAFGGTIPQSKPTAGSNNTRTPAPQVRSRFTERKPVVAVPPRKPAPQRATATVEHKKRIPSSGVILAKAKETKISSEAQADIRVKPAGSPGTNEASIQTNEVEILNVNNIVGDMKVMMPSKAVVADIENQRDEAKKRQLMKTQRKFEVYAEKEEAHLTDLKEFLEKSAVTKRVRKTKITLDLDKDLIHSMDELINKGVPKAESITDIKERIKKKEEELLGLFDNMERFKTVDRNTNSGV